MNRLQLSNSSKDIMDNINPPPACKNWTAKDEDVIKKLKTDLIPIGDTVLGRPNRWKGYT